MSTDHRDQLRQIRSFSSLIKYLRDELDWPIEAENLDDVTFDYDSRNWASRPRRRTSPRSSNSGLSCPGSHGVFSS